ncbi:MAG: ComEC/Rec2 family competence protein, partial [Persicimonas sp.]
MGVGIELGSLGLGAQICAGLGAVSASVGALRSRASRRAIFAALVGIFVGVLLVGSAAETGPATERLITVVSDTREDDQRLRAVVAGRVEQVGPGSVRGQSIDLAVERLDRIEFGADRPTVRLFVPIDFNEMPAALPGDRVEVFARLDLYPGQAFSRRRPVREIMAGRDLHVRATALEPLNVSDGHVGEGARMQIFDGLARRLVISRTRFERRLLDGLDTEHAALAVALSTGNRNYLEPAFVEPFQRTGTSHLLAISGLHLGVLAALLWWAIGLGANRCPWLLRRFGRRRVCGLAVMVLLGVYVLAIGAPVSATRAWVAIALGICALMLLRPVCPFHALAAAALGLVAAQPAVVAELGFQLSFAATASILVFLRFRPDVLEPPDDLFGAPEAALGRRLRQIGLFVGVSTSATVGTWPILAAHL